jgi:hypothetical protein
MEYQPDMFANPITYIAPGALMEALEFKQLRWPGHGIGDNTPFQFVENEYFKADEYDAFLADPSDWILRHYLPRTCGILQPFQRLIPLRHLTGYHSILPMMSILSNHDIVEALEALLAAARESQKMMSHAAAFNGELISADFRHNSVR